MAKKLKIWYDKDGDFFEILFSDKPGYFVETDNEFVMRRIDENGNTLGFSIMGISRIRGDYPLEAEFELSSLLA